MITTASEHQHGAYAITIDGETADRTFTDPTAAATAAQQLVRKGTPVSVVQVNSPDDRIYAVAVNGKFVQEFVDPAAAAAAAQSVGKNAAVVATLQDPTAETVAADLASAQAEPLIEAGAKSNAVPDINH